MNKRTYSVMTLTLLLAGMAISAFNIRATYSSEPPATEWSRTYGGTEHDLGNCAIQTPDGGYLIGGSTPGFGDYDIWIVKTDSYGNPQWNRTYIGAGVPLGDRVWYGTDAAHSVVRTLDGGYAIGGITKRLHPERQHWDFWLIKTDEYGNTCWNKTYGGDYEDFLTSMVQTNDGGYALAGRTHSFGGPTHMARMWLIKTDSAGNEEWTRTYGAVDNMSHAYTVTQTVDGGYALAGGTVGPFGSPAWNFWLVKTDEYGYVQWTKTYGGQLYGAASSMVQTVDGGYALVGAVRYLDSGDSNVLLVKTDASGNHLWSKTFGGAWSERYPHLVQTTDEGYALAASTDSFGAGERDFWLVKTTRLGNMQWNTTFGGAAFDDVSCTQQTSDEGYVLVGTTNSFGVGGWDIWVVKVEPWTPPPVVTAAVDINPDTLNLKSNGQWITAYITLPDGCSVGDVVLETVEVDGIPAVWSEIQNGVYMAKFDRVTVQTNLTNEPDYESAPKSYDLILTVRGELLDGTPFEGSDVVSVLEK